MSSEPAAPLGNVNRLTAALSWMASAATLLGFLGWLFLDETSHRRTLVASCLGLVLVCLGCVVLVGTIGRERRRGTGCAANYDVVRPRSAVPVATPSALPARLPVGRSVRVRGLVGAAAFLAALTGILAISAGDDTDATAAAAIRAAGAERVAVRVVGVTDVERFAGRGDTDFEARVTVQLPAPEGGSRPVSLDARTHDLPREGGRLAVIYAPGHLDLGAVHGDVDTLDRLLAGTALTPAERWAFLGSWGGVALLVVGVNVGGGALGGVSRLDGGHRAARGTVRGITAAEHGDGGTVLRVRTAHADVHFWAAQEIPAIAQSVADQQVWVCWRAEEGRKRLPAVLIGDEGWCLPGEVYGAQLGGAERDTYVVGEPGAPVEPERRVGLWLPVVSWPLRLPCGGVLLVLPSLAATAGMLTDVSGRGRWGLATAAVVGLLGACVAYLRSESGREGRAGREWGSRQGRGWS